MRWLKRLIWQWSSQGRELEEDCVVSTKRGSLVRSKDRDVYESDESLNIQLYKANGGKIVSFRSYDRKNDRNYSTVYIITDEQDFERELGKCITMESMKL